MLMNGALWTAGLARIMDTSLRYTVDKTTREILFLPLPVDVKYQAKPFIDVTVDRRGQGHGRADAAGPGPGLGPRPRLAATELRQHHDDGDLGRLRAECARAST